MHQKGGKYFLSIYKQGHPQLKVQKSTKKLVVMGKYPPEQSKINIVFFSHKKKAYLTLENRFRDMIAAGKGTLEWERKVPEEKIQENISLNSILLKIQELFALKKRLF